ncbi:MAG: flagellar assembly protein FliH [Pseudorhodobacter sp.]|nr:flagellar assembly protein FliH [Rhizobacter sp.]
MTTSKLHSAAGEANPPIGSNSKAASVHSRFIPREEMGSFSSWMPNQLEGGSAFAPSASSADLRAAAPPPPGSAYVVGVDRRRPVQGAPTAPTGAAAHAAITAAELAAAGKAARQSGYQDGYRDGLAAMESFKQSFATQVTAQVGTLMQSMNHQFDNLQQDMARAIAVSATRLAQHVVRCELRSQPELISAVACEALDALLQGARHTTVRVHPDDHALVAGAASQALREAGARLLSDAAVSRGGCLVESDIGLVDASIEARWQRAAAVLGSEQNWHSTSLPSAQALEQNDAPLDESTP